MDNRKLSIKMSSPVSRNLKSYSPYTRSNENTFIQSCLITDCLITVVKKLYSQNGSTCKCCIAVPVLVPHELVWFYRRIHVNKGKEIIGSMEGSRKLIKAKSLNSFMDSFWIASRVVRECLESSLNTYETY